MSGSWKTFFDHQLRALRYDYDDTLAKGKKVSDALKTLRVSVEDVCLRATLLLTKLPAYNDRFKTELYKGLAALLTQRWDAIKAFVKDRDFGIKKSVYVNGSVVDEALLTLETQLSHLSLYLSSVD